MEPFQPHVERVVREGAEPSAWMFVLHGLFGSAANLRPVARRLARARPDWGFFVLDLRGHGLSAGAPPPHSIEAVVGDLCRLEASLGVPIRGVLGHSFGGKVALAYAERRPDLGAVFVLDSAPGAREPDSGKGSARDVLALLEATPQPLPSRGGFIDDASLRLDRRTAEWLAMNLRAGDDGFRFRYDLAAIRDLLADYHALDLWHVVEDPARAGVIHVVVGGRSDAVPPADRARLSRHTSVRVLAGAGHWLHADDPDGLHRALMGTRTHIPTT